MDTTENQIIDIKERFEIVIQMKKKLFKITETLVEIKGKDDSI